MLHKKIDDALLSQMYNWLVGMKVREERNEIRFKLLLDMVNEGREDHGVPPLTMEELDKSMGYDPQAIMEKAAQYFDLPPDL